MFSDAGGLVCERHAEDCEERGLRVRLLFVDMEAVRSWRRRAGVERDSL
jgi:hypothetical protein